MAGSNRVEPLTIGVLYFSQRSGPNLDCDFLFWLYSHIKINNKNPGKTEYIHVRPSGTHDKSTVVATAEQMSNLVKDDNSTTVVSKEEFAITHLYVVPQHKIKVKLPNKPAVLKTMKMSASFSQLKKVHDKAEIDKMLERVGPGLHGFTYAVGRKVHKTNTVRYLGVHYDGKLTFKIQKMMTAASKGLGLLVRLTRIGCRRRCFMAFKALSTNKVFPPMAILSSYRINI